MPSYHPQRIEPKWQAYWERHKTFRTPDFVPDKPKLYVLDMFPYPSGAGLHVGHPEGYTATDIVCRYKRMRGFNVLHPMGWDAFGLPAEQYAIQTGTHPGVTTQANIATFKRQIQALGFSYDWDRVVNTTDPSYYKWTQWIFLKLFDTWYDPDFTWVDPSGVERKGKGRPITDLPIPEGTADPQAYRDSKRLAYRAVVPVNWCPALGTVLANEEVIDGKSERGDHPVVKMPLKQWMLRITAYAERLVDDLEALDWSRAIKDMQRNWVGRSEGAEVDFKVERAFDPAILKGNLYQRIEVAAEQAVSSWSESHDWKWERRSRGFPETPEPSVIRVFTTRPDTLFGATYMVLAPEHPLVDEITTAGRRPEVTDYRERTSHKSEIDRAGQGKVKSGVFTGSHATNPVNGKPIPIWIADYVLMGYGTGAIMAVPAHDERDLAFARQFGLEIRRVVASEADKAHEPLEVAEAEYGFAVNSSNSEISIDGLDTAKAKARITHWLTEAGMGRKTVNYKLRDWLFSRQRYWGEPFPILLDKNDRAYAVPESELPVMLPELADFLPSGKPEPPLGKAADWVRYSETLRRETNTMPQWAGSCWYYLRYIDPANDQQPWSPEKERHWMPVDLYIGGAEHAVLHLLYSRFWHKVLFDRGYVSTVEPFQKLVNQGMILGEVEYSGYQDAEGRWVAQSDEAKAVKLDEDQVVKKGEGFYLQSDPSIRITARAHKMSKSRGNVINPDDVIQEYGADSLRLYEMFMGPLEAVKPWSMKGVEGVYRFLARAWRLVVDDLDENVVLDRRIQDVEPVHEQRRLVARTVAAVTDDLDAHRFNTSISRLMEFTNAFTGQEVRPKAAIKTFVLLLAPLAPHMAEELWEALGETETLAYAPWPTYDPADLVDDEVEIPIQINGKLKARISMAAEHDAPTLEAAARGDARIAALLDGKSVKKVVVIPGKMVNFVVAV